MKPERDDLPTPVTLSDIRLETGPMRRGPWRLDAETRTLDHVKRGYWIPLDKCRTSAEVLDWIAQISAKAWTSDADLGAFTRLLCDVLDVQARLCSGGRERGPRDPGPAIERYAEYSTGESA